MKKDIKCKGCLFYDEVEDEIGRMYNENGPLYHYCDVYKEGIPEEIWKQKKVCRYYLE